MDGLSTELPDRHPEWYVLYPSVGTGWVKRADYKPLGCVIVTASQNYRWRWKYFLVTGLKDDEGKDLIFNIYTWEQYIHCYGEVPWESPKWEHSGYRLLAALSIYPVLSGTQPLPTHVSVLPFQLPTSFFPFSPPPYHSYTGQDSEHPSPPGINRHSHPLSAPSLSVHHFQRAQ